MSTRMETDDRSIGQLMSEVTRDIGQLVRQEIELAKTETKEEVQRAGRAGAMFGAAGLLGFLAVLLLSFAVAWALAEAMPAGVAFLIVGAVYAIAAFVAAQRGRQRMKQFDPVPHETVETIKEDVQWVRARKS
jgi:uncharacterized membrane protein YqjE